MERNGHTHTTTHWGLHLHCQFLGRYLSGLYDEPHISPSILSLSLKKTEVQICLLLALLVLSYWIHTFCWVDWGSLPYCTPLCHWRWGLSVPFWVHHWSSVDSLMQTTNRHSFFWKTPYQGMGDCEIQCLGLEYSFLLPIPHPLWVRSCSTPYRGHSFNAQSWP